MSEKSVVQSPLIKYVSSKQLGWNYIGKDKAVELRHGKTGLFFL